MKGSNFLMKLYLHSKINAEYSMNFTENFIIRFDEGKRNKSTRKELKFFFLNFCNNKIKKYFSHSPHLI